MVNVIFINAMINLPYRLILGLTEGHKNTTTDATSDGVLLFVTLCLEESTTGIIHDEMCKSGNYTHD